MIMKRAGKPKFGELVICRITNIHPNSAFAKLIEYDVTGMIHVSEVAKKWVRNIKEFLKENQYVVCRVMNVEKEAISLSVKRVRREEAERKLREFKREKRAEHLLDMVAKETKKSLEDVYREIGYDLQEAAGSLNKGFETAFKKPDLLIRKGLPKKWVDILNAVAKKSYTEKVYRLKGKLNIVCYKPDGVKIIKKVMTGAEKDGFEVRYVSAPTYEIVGTGKNFKELETKVTAAGNNIVKEIESNGGEGSFELVEE